MIATSLCELLISTKTDTREPLKGRTKEVAEAVDASAYEFVHPPEAEVAQRRRLAIYFVAAYLALC